MPCVRTTIGMGWGTGFYFLCHFHFIFLIHFKRPREAYLFDTYEDYDCCHDFWGFTNLAWRRAWQKIHIFLFVLL